MLSGEEKESPQRHGQGFCAREPIPSHTALVTLAVSTVRKEAGSQRKPSNLKKTDPRQLTILRCIHSQEAKRSESWRSSCHLFSPSLGPQPLGWCHSHLGWVFPSQLMETINFLRHTHRALLVSMVILSTIKLTIEINHHTFTTHCVRLQSCHRSCGVKQE